MMSHMSFKRTATLLVVGAALAAWLYAAANSGVDSAPPLAAGKTPPIDQRGAALASEIARLHDQLRPSATPRQPSRNLFSYGARPVRQASLPPAEIPKPALTEVPAARPAAPVLKLSGIAEDNTPAGWVRTAVISTAGQLYLAKEGEKVTDRFQVVKISSDAVELTDLTDNAVVRLALR